jgi:hypothetical protein
MRPLAVFLITLEAALGFSLSCSSLINADPQVTGPIGVVRFPTPWIKMINNSERGVNDNIGYVIRKSVQGELLFAVKQGFTGELFGKEVSDFPVESPNYDYYSDNQFAVSLDGAFRVRESTTEEWNAATKPLHSYHVISSFKNGQVAGDGVQYNGHLYRKSGESWGTEVALVSPRQTWIAVLSYTSREKPDPGFIPGLGGSEPGHGEVFLDLYNVSSGVKVIGARSPYGGTGSGFAPSMLFGASLWVEDRYFIMPLDWVLDGCLLGILPER